MNEGVYSEPYTNPHTYMMVAPQSPEYLTIGNEQLTENTVYVKKKKYISRHTN